MLRSPSLFSFYFRHARSAARKQFRTAPFDTVTLAAISRSDKLSRRSAATRSPLKMANQPIGWRASSVLSENLGMCLQISQRETEAIVILDLKGELVLGDEDLSLLQRLLFLLDSRRHKVILNLKEVFSIDASGLATLAFCATRFHDVGGRLVLVNSGKQSAQVAATELNTVLENYQEEADAVNSFLLERVVPHYDILEFVTEQEKLRNRNP